MMHVKQWVKLTVAVVGLVSLTACSSAHKSSQSAIDDANAAYGAHASGMGDESGFGDSASRRGLSNRVYYFDYDSNVVHDEDRPAINANANYLLAHANAKVMLEGHTDPRGSREYNIGLGERRAQSVAQILTSKGVDASQIRVVSYGSEKLASLGHTDEAYQLDRRVVLVYLNR